MITVVVSIHPPPLSTVYVNVYDPSPNKIIASTLTVLGKVSAPVALVSVQIPVPPEESVVRKVIDLLILLGH